MFDINKYLAHANRHLLGGVGQLSELPHWSPKQAHRLAAEEGIELEEAHWRVIYRLRERFDAEGPEWTARRLTRELAEDFAAAGGRRHLYQLFPHGPIAQGCKIAGLPLPQGTFNRSFGSAH